MKFMNEPLKLTIDVGCKSQLRYRDSRPPFLQYFKGSGLEFKKDLNSSCHQLYATQAVTQRSGNSGFTEKSFRSCTLHSTESLSKRSSESEAPRLDSDRTS